MATPINTPLTSEIWHLSIDDLLQPLPESPRLGGSGPFVINLSASTAPISQPMKSLAECPSAHVYQIQRTEDRRLRYRLRLGPFGTEDEAEAILSKVRDIYPSALTATAEMDDLRAIGTLQAKAEAQQQLAAAKSIKASASKSVAAASIPALRAVASPAEPSLASASPPAATPAPLTASAAPPKAAAKPHPVAPVAPVAPAVPAAPLAKPMMTVPVAPIAPATPAAAQAPSQPTAVAVAAIAKPPQAAVAPQAVTAQLAVPRPVAPAPVAWVPPTLSIAPEPPVLSRPVAPFQEPVAIALTLAQAFPVGPKVSAASQKAPAPAITHPASISITHAAVSIPVLSDSVAVTRRPVVVPTRPQPPVIEVEFSPARAPVAPSAIAAPTPNAAPAPTAAPPPPAATVAEPPAPRVVAAPSAAAVPVAPAAPRVAAAAPRRVQEIVPPAPVSAAAITTSARKVSTPAPKAAAPVAVKAAQAAPPKAAAPKVSPPAPVRQVESPLPSLEMTQTLRPLTPLELQDDSSASRWFVIQLSLSEESFDPDSLPNLDIFNEYRLYCVAGIDQGKIMHALRVGFFAEEVAAAAVASYLGAFYEKPTIKRISLAERERFADQRVEARKDIGATGRHAVIEITNERVIREKRTAATTVTPLPARPAAPQSARKGK